MRPSAAVVSEAWMRFPSPQAARQSAAAKDKATARHVEIDWKTDVIIIPFTCYGKTGNVTILGLRLCFVTDIFLEAV